MRKFFLVFVVLALVSGLTFAQFEFDKKFELSFTGGFGLTQLKGDSQYNDQWNYFLLTNVEETADVALTSKNAFNFGGAFAYFFMPNFGVQLGGGYFSPKVDIANSWTMYWRWSDGRQFTRHSGEDDYDAVPDTAGKFSTVPLYLNLIGKYRAGMFEIFGTAGPTLYMNSFEADAYSVYGITGFWWIFQYIDWCQIPMEVAKTSWTAVGFNAGLGFDIRFSPSIAFTVEGRYFFCPAKDDFAWDWIEGEYEGVNGNLTLNMDDFSDAEELTTPMKVKPSFFSIAGGFKIYL